jgi:large subunit ribosomal protein L9
MLPPTTAWCVPRRKLRKEKENALRSQLEDKAKAQAFANALATIGKFVLKKKAGDKDQLYST